MRVIAAAVSRHPQCVVVLDEVYDRITLGPWSAADSPAQAEAVSAATVSTATAKRPSPQHHISFASLPGMWDRCVTLSSGGKTFSCTGFKIAWAVGPAELIRPIVLMNQWMSFCVSTPLQVAMARSLERALQPYQGFETYYHALAGAYGRRRQRLIHALSHAGLRPVVPEAGFFVMADTSRVPVPEAAMRESSAACAVTTRDWAVCRTLTRDAGVAAIPPTAFCAAGSDAAAHMEQFARFAFCKSDDSIEEGGRRLAHFMSREPR